MLLTEKMVNSDVKQSRFPCCIQYSEVLSIGQTLRIVTCIRASTMEPSSQCHSYQKWDKVGICTSHWRIHRLYTRARQPRCTSTASQTWCLVTTLICMHHLACFTSKPCSCTKALYISLIRSKPRSSVQSQNFVRIAGSSSM